MNFSDPPRRAPADTLLPMINVVFLLLIFFLMSAQLKSPEPFDLLPPEAVDAAEARGDFALFLSAEGLPGYRDQTADAAIAALAAARAAHCAVTDCIATPPRLSVRADARVAATTLAALLPRLQTLGFAQMELLTRPIATGAP